MIEKEKVICITGQGYFNYFAGSTDELDPETNKFPIKIYKQIRFDCIGKKFIKWGFVYHNAHNIDIGTIQ